MQRGTRSYKLKVAPKFESWDIDDWSTEVRMHANFLAMAEDDEGSLTLSPTSTLFIANAKG